MERFGRVLRRVDRHLEVREPERSRILLELALDLEDLYLEYRTRGHSPEEARRRAEAWLAPDADALHRLRHLHTPVAGRLLSSLSEVGRSRLETAALTLLALLAVAAALGGLSATHLLWPPGPAAVAVLVLAGLGVAVAGRRVLDLLLSPDQGLRVPAWVPGPLAFGAATALTGALGGFLHLWSALVLTDPETWTTAFLWGRVGAAAGTAALGLAAALVLALLWFWLVVRARTVRVAREELREFVVLAGATLDTETTGG